MTALEEARQRLERLLGADWRVEVRADRHLVMATHRNGAHLVVSPVGLDQADDHQVWERAHDLVKEERRTTTALLPEVPTVDPMDGAWHDHWRLLQRPPRDGQG